jgi:hypothetical protein
MTNNVLLVNVLSDCAMGVLRDEQKCPGCGLPTVVMINRFGSSRCMECDRKLREANGQGLTDAAASG